MNVRNEAAFLLPPSSILHPALPFCWCTRKPFCGCHNCNFGHCSLCRECMNLWWMASSPKLSHAPSLTQFRHRVAFYIHIYYISHTTYKCIWIYVNFHFDWSKMEIGQRMWLSARWAVPSWIGCRFGRVAPEFCSFSVMESKSLEAPLKQSAF